MDLMIYSDDALEMIKLGELTQKETLDYFKEHSKNDVAQVKAIIGAYSAELIVAAEEARVPLDLTFETVRNIPEALSSLYVKQFNMGIADPRNKELTCRALAAYMDLLVINNFDDCSIDARRYPNKNNEASPERWTGFLALILDGKKNSDMLPFVWKGADLGGEVENGFTVDIAPLVEGFKKLTGVRLSDEGLRKMTLTHGRRGEKEKKLILPGQDDELIVPGAEKKLIL